MAYFLHKTFNNKFGNLPWHNLGKMKHFEAVFCFMVSEKDLETIPMCFSAVGSLWCRQIAHELVQFIFQEVGSFFEHVGTIFSHLGSTILGMQNVKHIEELQGTTRPFGGGGTNFPGLRVSKHAQKKTQGSKRNVTRVITEWCCWWNTNSYGKFTILYRVLHKSGG